MPLSSEFKKLEDFIMPRFAEKGVDITTLIERKMANAREAGHPVSRAVAEEEVVADAMQTMLSDEKDTVINTLRDLNSENPGLFKKLKQKLDQFAESLHRFYNEMKNRGKMSQEGRIVSQMGDEVDELRKLFAEALNTAGKNFSAAGKNNSDGTGTKLEARVYESFLSENVEEDEKYTDFRKEKQLSLIRQLNPAEDNYHTWIRNKEDILSFAEAVEADGGEAINPDFSKKAIRKALNSGRVTIYSSKPFKNGGFVTTSRMMASDYAGGGRVYFQTVNTSDVAWIDSTEGQLAIIDKSDPLTIDNRAKTGNNSSINWVYSQKLFSQVENDRFMNAVSAIKHGVGGGYTRLPSGGYSIQVGNKIIFTDGKYGKPEISSVIEVMTSNEEAVTNIKEAIDNAVSGYWGYDAAREIVSLSYPNAHIWEYSIRDSTARSWFDGRNSGKEREEIVRDYFRMRNGTGDSGENSTVQEVNQGKPSSSDGGFSDGTRFSYRGEKSQGADLTALGQAKQMFESGESSENIRQTTGWFKGYDGKWRYEIDDSKMELTGELIKFVDGTELGKLIKHNELFAAYPQLKNVKVRVLDSADVNGSADPDGNDIYINSRLLQNTDAEKKRNEIFQSDEYKDYSEKLAQLHKARELASKPLLDRFVEEASNGNAEAAAKARDEYKKAVSEYDKQIDQLTEAWSQSELGQQVAKLSEKSLQEGEQLSEDAKYTLIHEIQHFIQYYESFANGSNPEEWEGKIYDALSQKKKEAKSKLLKYATPENNLKELIYQYDELINRINGDDSDALRRMASAYDAIAKKINDEDIEEAFFEYSNATEEFVTAFAGDNLRSKGMEYYRRTAGEVESRDVSSRLDYSAEQRKNTRPDIDRADVVFADDNGISLFAIKPDTDIENKNIANGNKVLDSMIEQAKTVENPETLIYKNAMYRSDIGQIDFVWGKPGNGARFKKGYGISHIIAKHGETTAKKAIEVIAKGTDYTKQGNNSTDESHYRIRLNYDGYTVVLSKDADSNHWLLTAWDNKEETAEYATVEVRDSTGATAATPTLNRRSGVNTTVSTDNIPNSDKNVKQFSLRDSDGNTLSEQQAEYSKDSKVRDEDGNLIVVYHGTDADFTVFDHTKARANMDIQGSFFSPWEIDAGGYGSNVGAYYLNITNPADESTGYKALRRFQGQNEAGKKAREYLISLGYDGVNNGGEEYIAFYPEQIKEADNLNPTDDPDVRYSERTADVREDEEEDVLFRELAYLASKGSLATDDASISRTIDKVKQRVKAERAENARTISQLRQLLAAQGKPSDGKIFTKTSINDIVSRLKRDYNLDVNSNELYDRLTDYFGWLVDEVSDISGSDKATADTLAAEYDFVIARALETALWAGSEHESPDISKNKYHTSAVGNGLDRSA